MPAPFCLETDVLIVGAGAAGLAAASELSAARIPTVILEARDRIGGRAYTRLDVATGTHVELGAEFVHGYSDVVREWLAATGTTIIDAAQTRRTLVRGRFVPSDPYFDRMKRDLARLRRPAQDLPFGEFLGRASRRILPARSRQFALAIVEGFDAADASRVSTRDTLDAWAGPAAADAPTFRPRGGYGAMLEAIRSRLDPARSELRLGHAVQDLVWQRGAVRAVAAWQAERVEVAARCAIITLPVGVLQSPPEIPDAIRFDPPLRRKRRALSGLAMGPVIKAVLSFREPFWEQIDRGAQRDTAFFFVPDAVFPTFWTTLPVRSTNLVAWAGGSKAIPLSGRGESAITRAALDSLDAIFGGRIDSRRYLRASYVHDWQADPYARGGYSYVVAGGSGARARLAKPLDDTLFFAGEATDTMGEYATVMGALRSGQRAAREVMRRRTGDAARRR
jgi:monoamine oxidase